MASNFEKRKNKKEPTPELSQTEPVGVVAGYIAPSPFTQSGLDVFTRDGGRTYEVAEIFYNPETNEAKVVETFTISRLVALSYKPQKDALRILKKRKI